MNTSLQHALPFVLILFCALPAGNYMLNRDYGVVDSANVRESGIWGVGFMVFAILDYFFMTL